MFLNTRGLASPTKLQNIVNELNLLNCDVVFLQETHVSSCNQAACLEKLWNGNFFWSFGIGRSAGVAVLFRSSFPGRVIRFLTDTDGRVLSLLISVANFKLNLVNIYSPNTVSERKVFFSRLHEYFISQGDLIVGGDFNCVDNVLDKLNCSFVSSADQKLLCSLRTDFSLVDVWRKQNTGNVEFIWSNSSHTQASRIDRFFFLLKISFLRFFRVKLFLAPCLTMIL